jgi:glycosyltransferase involved in cell wall biosynthesis
MRRIYFFKLSSNSLKNPVIARMLRDEFKADVVTIDVLEDVIMRSPALVARAMAETLWRQRYQVFRLRHNPKYYLPLAPSAHRYLRRFVEQKVDPNDTLFVFQNQSLFDSSRSGVPFFIYTDHTYRANFRNADNRWFRPSPPDRLARERRMYSAATACFTTCEFTRKSLIEDYGIPTERVHTIESGANTPVSNLPARKEFAGRVVFVGVDWERKGGPDLVSAVQRLRKNFPSATLRVCGCSPLVRAPGIEVLGRLSPAEISRNLAECDVFCLPTYWDTSPMALAEAALHGLPSVASNVGGIPERVIDGVTGFVIQPGDLDALTERLGRFFAAPTLAAEMGRRAFDHAREKFTWEAVQRKLGAHIHAALATLSPVP